MMRNTETKKNLVKYLKLKLKNHKKSFFFDIRAESKRFIFGYKVNKNGNDYESYERKDGVLICKQHLIEKKLSNLV